MVHISLVLGAAHKKISKQRNFFFGYLVNIFTRKKLRVTWHFCKKRKKKCPPRRRTTKKGSVPFQSFIYQTALSRTKKTKTPPSFPVSDPAPLTPFGKMATDFVQHAFERDMSIMAFPFLPLYHKQQAARAGPGMFSIMYQWNKVWFGCLQNKQT